MDQLLKKLSPNSRKKKENANVNTVCDMPETGSSANGAGPSGGRREANGRKNTPTATKRKTAGRKSKLKSKKDTQDEDDQVCSVCETATAEVLCCDCCDTWHCQKCAKLPSEIFEIIGNYDSIQWFCPKCKDRVAHLLRNCSDNVTDKTTNQTMIKKLENIEEGLSEIRAVCDSQLSMTAAIHKKTTETTINLAEHDWPNLGEAGTSEMKKQPPGPPPPKMATHTSGVQVLNEFADRERRKNNIIVHNIAESTGDTAGLREAQDKITIQDLIKNGLKVDDNVEKLARLGKRNTDRPRLLLVTLSCERSKILTTAWRLKNNSKWENTYIDPDRTLQEREEHKALRRELKRRREAGEDNLVIRDGAIVKLPWHKRGRSKTNNRQQSAGKTTETEHPAQENTQNRQQTENDDGTTDQQKETKQQEENPENQPQITTEPGTVMVSETPTEDARNSGQMEQPRGESSPEQVEQPRGETSTDNM